jgi:hypothetical protein
VGFKTFTARETDSHSENNRRFFVTVRTRLKMGIQCSSEDRPVTCHKHEVWE